MLFVFRRSFPCAVELDGLDRRQRANPVFGRKGPGFCAGRFFLFLSRRSRFEEVREGGQSLRHQLHAYDHDGEESEDPEHSEDHGFQAIENQTA